MSVRRLADEAVQPAAFAFSATNQSWAERKIAEYPVGRQQSAVIPLLFRAQEQEGWVTRAAIEAVARMLDMAYIRVLEVATFYTQFQLKPVGTRAHIQVCGTTPCMLRGAEALREVCQHKVNHDPFVTTADGTMSWEEVECLGACVNAPLVMIGKDTYEDLTPERLEEIIAAFAAGKGDTVAPGPQIVRQFASAEGGATTLTEAPTAERTYTPFPPPPAPAPAAPAPAAPAAAPAAPASVAKGTEAAAGKVDGGVAAVKATPSAGGKPAPRRLFETPAGEPDDLQLISGVGPVLEGNLHAVGITKWSQVAKLTAEQIDAVEGELGFKGRVLRDKWLEQADALARGGVEEYRRIFGKDPR